ncbi:MAG: histidine phosphatase family protein [Lachnospiraceae bacterium]|nr:histidine phosphatase family protein [Lachnospiraceae bacterium]
MLLFYVRHGDPIYKPDSLTELGKNQAEALVSRMKEYDPDKIYASSSNRAIMTAEPTAKFLQKEIEVLDWCKEGYAWEEFTIIGENDKRKWCFLDDDTKKIFVSEDIRKLDKYWYEHPQFKGLKFQAGLERIQKETDKFMYTLGYKHDRERNGYIPVRANEDRVALFAHQGFGFGFLSCLLDIPYPQIVTHFDMSHSGVTVIVLEAVNL